MKEHAYAPVSLAAVGCLAFAVLALGGFVYLPLTAFTVPAFVFALIGVRGKKMYGLAGRRLAQFGLPLSLAIAAGAPLYDAWQFRSEAPAGYRRLSFSNDLDNYVGQQICLKGYALLTGDTAVDRFVITDDGYSRDPNNPILVELPDGRLWEMTTDGVAVSGRFERLPPSDDDRYPRYVLRDAVVRPSRTLYQIGGRDTSEGC
jgi:hypothetical protein